MNVLLLIDLINEMVHPRGKLASKGYAEFAMSANSATNVAKWRSSPDIDRVIHVGLEFRPDYCDAARSSLLLGKAPDFGVARRGESGAQFVEWAAPEGNDIVLRKSRISAFFGTDLEIILKSLGATKVTIGGVATDLAVSSAARDAHDRDYEVSIASSVCIAASQADHEGALRHLEKIAKIE